MKPEHLIAWLSGYFDLLSVDVKLDRIQYEIRKKIRESNLVPIDFCYWLQGYYELGGEVLENKEWHTIVQDHISLVFKKETPVYNPIEFPPKPIPSSPVPLPNPFPPVWNWPYDPNFGRNIAVC